MTWLQFILLGVGINALQYALWCWHVRSLEHVSLFRHCVGRTNRQHTNGRQSIAFETMHAYACIDRPHKNLMAHRLPTGQNYYLEIGVWKPRAKWVWRWKRGRTA